MACGLLTITLALTKFIVPNVSSTPTPSIRMPGHPRLGSASAYTLVELLIAMVLVGILVTVAVPSIVRSTSAHSVDHQARQIHSWLSTARARAVAEQRPYRFELHAGGAYEIQHQEGGVWFSDGGSAVAEGITMKIGNASSGTLAFRTHGQIDTPATIEIHDGTHSRRINVLASGQIRWVSGRK